MFRRTVFTLTVSFLFLVCFLDILSTPAYAYLDPGANSTLNQTIATCIVWIQRFLGALFLPLLRLFGKK